MQKKIIENDIEVALRDKIRALGGKAFKWVSPGTRGVPDRIVVLPGSRIVFVELKAPGKSSTPWQLKQQRDIRRLGFEVRVIDTLEKVEAFVEEMRIE